MIPGVSRSGASIVAAMLLGGDKRTAAEFSFFLAIPTMIGAFAYDFYKNRAEMTTDHIGIVAIGFVMANSAGDARGSELEIRKKLIQSGAVDEIVSIGSNFFYTVTLPCTLWFFDKAKARGP